MDTPDSHRYVESQEDSVGHLPPLRWSQVSGGEGARFRGSAGSVVRKTPMGHCHRQRLRQEKTAPVPPWSAFSGTTEGWASGTQVGIWEPGPATPGQSSSLCECVSV